MKLNGALKPRQGASRQGSSPGVVLRKYRDKRYNKLSKNVVYGLSPYKSGPSYMGQKQSIVTNSKNINRQKQKTQSQQTPIQKRQQNVYNSLSRQQINDLKSQNKSTIIVLKRSVCSVDFDSNRKDSDIKALILAKKEKQKENKKNNITTRQVKQNNKKDKIYLNNNNNINTYTSEKEIKQMKKFEVVKTTQELVKHHVNVNKTNNNNNNNNNNKYNKTNNSDLIYSMEQQQQQKEQQLVVNKFLSIVNLYENLILFALTILAAIISRLILQLKLLLFFMYSHAIKLLDAGYPIDYSNRNGIGNHHNKGIGFSLAKIMRASQSLGEPFHSISIKNVNNSRLNSSIALWMVVVCATVTILLPQPVAGDDGDNFFPINSIETTTPEFDYASRGQKKFGDKCENTLECGFPGSICDPKKKSCQCTEDLPVTNHIDKCGKEAAVNESCFFNEQCEVKYFQTECRDQRCVCRFDMTPVWLKDGTVECKGRGDKKGPETYIDPAMIGVLVGMALMFIIICVVLRLFSQARWRENRTIFNTPNPRLMNVSLLRESKLLHGQERRGSRMSVRVPSRQPSMASLRPHSPNPSLGKTGRMTRSKSNTRSSESRVSDASNCSRLLEHHNTANVHHASHSPANAINHSQSTHVPYTSASVSPLSINAPITTLTNQTPVADISTACTKNLTTPPPTTTNKTNKF